MTEKKMVIKLTKPPKQCVWFAEDDIMMLKNPLAFFLQLCLTQRNFLLTFYVIKCEARFQCIYMANLQQNWNLTQKHKLKTWFFHRWTKTPEYFWQEMRKWTFYSFTVPLAHTFHTQKKDCNLFYVDEVVDWHSTLN